MIVPQHQLSRCPLRKLYIALTLSLRRGDYAFPMLGFLFHWISKLLVFLFFAGLCGSAIVVLITFYEDGKLLFERDEAAKGTSSAKAEDVHSSAMGEHA